ncbi:MAG: tetratricopeptide repeat protein [Flavobacteriales bacterium]|jgi:tetratricopeptide (TPR) repeat protein/anti-sigma regulatory factor (Ser/Thr protein kinase)|nr:tetratricopeptide repeat protein [Flavobacteriales bacterium]
MRSLLLVFAINYCVLLSAQDASLVPGIRADLAAARNDTLRADALARLCFNLVNSNPDSSRYYGEQALALATRIGNARAIADAHNNLGWLETQQGHIPEATEHLNIALMGFRRIGNPSYTSIALSNLGWLADKQGDRTGALQRFDEALDQATLATDSASMAVLLYSIGSTYNKMQEYGRARIHLERSLAIEEQLGRPNKQGNCLVAIGNAWRSEEDAAKAMEYYQRAAALFSSTNNHYGSGMVLENSGDLFLENDPKKALPYYQRALAHYDTLHSAADKAYILQRIGMAYSGMKKYAEAEISYTEGLGLASASSSTELVMELHLSLAELAVKQGKSEVAIGHYQRHMALKDSLRSEDSERELMRLRATFETEQAEQENVLLKAENALSHANEAKMKARWTAAAAVSIGLVLLLALLYRNYRQRGRHTQEVERFNTELQGQRDQVQHMNDLLELKILRSQLNPHFIHNCQNSAIAMVKEGRSIEALAYLQGLSKLMRMVLEHSVNDRITVEEEMSFLRLYVKLESLRLPGLQCEVNADRELLDDEAELPALLVQPFVENALWHGLAEKEGPRQLSILFSATEKGVRCTVRDNGLGRRTGTNPSTTLPSTPLREGAEQGHRSLGTELTNERLQLLTHRLQQKGSFVIHDLKDAAGDPAGTEVVIELEG